MSRAPVPPPGPRRLGRGAVAAIVLLAVIVVALFVGRNLWHATEVNEPPPETQGNP